MEFLAAALVAFVAIFPVELPDKTFVATLVLSTRYPALQTWIGVVLAFAVQVVIAVTAGHLLAQLPTRPVQFAAAGLFAVGAVILLVTARRSISSDEYLQKAREPKKGWRAIGASFLVLFTAEWGDLSQLVIAGLVASGRDPIGTGAGGLLALATVSGLAVLLGRWLMRHIRLSLIRYIGAGVCGTLAVVTLISAA